MTLSYGGDASYFLIYSAVVEGLVSAGMDMSKQSAIDWHVGPKAQILNRPKSVNSIHLNSVPAFNPNLGYAPYISTWTIFADLASNLAHRHRHFRAGQWRQKGYWQVSPITTLMWANTRLHVDLSLFASFYVGYCYHWYHVSIQASLGVVALWLLPFYWLPPLLGSP